jgi:error-prone DNA polymerase
MGWDGRPDLSWQEINAALSDRPGERRSDGRTRTGEPGRDGGDSPAWSHHRLAYEPPRHLQPRPDAGAVPYAELHCHSNFSFLDGASHPEELVEEAARLGLEALATTDHDGLYGVVRASEAARTLGVPLVVGAELSIGLSRPQNGVADPEGCHLLVLADGPSGYARLARTISEAHLRGEEKGRPVLSLEQAAQHLAGHAHVLTGCRKGAVPAALVALGPAAARRRLDQLVALFGRDRVAVELWDHGDPLDSARNDALAALAVEAGLPVVATNNVHYATPARRPLATALAAVRARRSLDDVDGWLPPASTACLRSGAEQARRFARWPGAVAQAAALGRQLAFDLRLVAPKLPDCPVPAGHTEMSWLRHLAEEGATFRYGSRPPEVRRRWHTPRPAARVAGHQEPRPATQATSDPGRASPNPVTSDPRDLRPGSEVTESCDLRPGSEVTGDGGRPVGSCGQDGQPPDKNSRAWRQIDHELDVIEELGFPGYFLVVHDIVDFCRRNDIYCQGRGSAANSAVCFALGITKADAVGLGLLFERFLSPERDGPPDIDIDIESQRREEAIQHVYERYGREKAAQVANVITYRARSAVRDMGKALGASQGQVDAWSKQVDMWGRLHKTIDAGGHDIPPAVLELAREVEDFPRHLGIHSGGMVICDRPVVEVCPVEWGRMEGRTVLQWDKDDCAAAGLVKFDLLGLGMLSMLHHAVDLIGESTGIEVDLAAIPQDQAVYEMLSRADSVGVFQVESRAQMATLPRLKPRCFYDLVVEVALIRPGPIQGGSVHPYIRRRNGEEEVTYLHPLMKPALEKTLGVPLFQEQLMQLAIDCAGFTPAEADQLRQAMGSKRSRERMEQMHARFTAGATERGIPLDVIDVLWLKLAAFSSYGFPESHSVSFAYLVYASSWVKLHHPAAFCAALLNAQPMGFWSPQTICADARRHGVVVKGPDVNASRALAFLDAEGAVRRGLQEVRTLGEDRAKALAAGRPYRDMEDVARRNPALTLANLEALATAGAFTESFSLSRREALWSAGAVSQSRPDRLAGIVTGGDAPQLPGLAPVEEEAFDLWSTGVSAGSPVRFVRERLAALGVVTASDLEDQRRLPAGSRVLVAGVVTHRQRPATAEGTTFFGLEDETGLLNVIVSPGCWAAFRRPARGAAALLIQGRLERKETVVNIVAEKLEQLDLRVSLPGAAPSSAPPGPRSRDFR